MLFLSLFTDPPWVGTWKLVLIVVGGVAFVIAVVLIIRCLVRRQPNNNQNNDLNQERQRLVDDGDGGRDALKNNFPDGTRSANLRNVSPLLPTSSASSCSDITVPKKDNLYNVKVSNHTDKMTESLFVRSFNVILSANQKA